MKFYESGNPEGKMVVLLHGAGLAAWSLEPLRSGLSAHYHVVAVDIDGYGGAAETDFISIRESAKQLLDYVNARMNGHVTALCGLSLGAQIVVETLCLAPDCADYALIESALIRPNHALALLTAPMCRMSYGLISKRWFSRMQARALCVGEGSFECYYTDSQKISLATLIHTLKSNQSYAPSAALSQVTARALILVGSREQRSMRLSADQLCKLIPDARLKIAAGAKHGELSLRHPAIWLRYLDELIQK